MVQYLVDGQLVDPNGNPVESNPFADFPEAVKKSLEAAGLTTVEAVKEYGEEGLVALEGIGPAIAKKLLALE